MEGMVWLLYGSPRSAVNRVLRRFGVGVCSRRTNQDGQGQSSLWRFFIIAKVRLYHRKNYNIVILTQLDYSGAPERDRPPVFFR